MRSESGCGRIDMERVFLDWDGALLGRAAKWLTGEFGGDSGCDLSGVVVALPGARPGRILEELLAREVGAGLRPPKIVTSGVLSDELLDVEGSAASRLVRTLAWERALRELPSNKLARVVARPPAADDHDGWAALAEEVRGLFGEIAAAGLDFAAVAQSSILEDLTGEVQRWLALGAAQEHMVSVLDEVGLHDPHIGRLTAIEAGRVRQPRHVVLIGVVEMNELLRRALTLCGSAQTALVFAPEAEAQRFDSFGCLLAGRSVSDGGRSAGRHGLPAAGTHSGRQGDHRADPEFPAARGVVVRGAGTRGTDLEPGCWQHDHRPPRNGSVALCWPWIQFGASGQKTRITGSPTATTRISSGNPMRQ